MSWEERWSGWDSNQKEVSGSNARDETRWSDEAWNSSHRNDNARSDYSRSDWDMNSTWSKDDWAEKAPEAPERRDRQKDGSWWTGDWPDSQTWQAAAEAKSAEAKSAEAAAGISSQTASAPTKKVSAGKSSSSSSSSSSSPSGSIGKLPTGSSTGTVAVNVPQWVVAIPSYDRPEVLKTKTLALLKRGNVPPNRIYVFADPRQMNEYEKDLKGLEWFKDVHVIQGMEGICSQRNAIAAHFAKLDIRHITEIDDDIEDVICLQDHRGSQPRPVAVTKGDGEMQSLLDAIWGFTESQGCKLWGIFTSSNGLFMAAQQTKVTVGVVKCTGQLMGYVNPPLGSPDAVKLNVSVMEDLQRCFIYAQKGWKCIRFNFLAVKTVNRAKGGCSSAFKVRDAKHCKKDDAGKKTFWGPRAVEEDIAAKALQKAFSGYVTIQAAKPKPTFFASEGGDFDFYTHGPSLRMKPKVAGTEHKSLRSFSGHEQLCLSCGIKDFGAGDEEALAEEGQLQEDESRDGEADQRSVQQDVSFILLNKLTVKTLQQKIEELGLQQPKVSKGTLKKADYISVLREHEMKQMAARYEEAIESKNKAEQDLAYMQKRTWEQLMLARKEKEAVRQVFNRQREEQESANAAAQAETVKHQATLQQLALQQKAKEDVQMQEQRLERENEELRSKLESELIRENRRIAEVAELRAQLDERHNDTQLQLHNTSQHRASRSRSRSRHREQELALLPSSASAGSASTQPALQLALQRLPAGNQAQEPAQGGAHGCFHKGNPNMGCLDVFDYAIWMTSKAKPKYREVCKKCGDDCIVEGRAKRYDPADNGT